MDVDEAEQLVDCVVNRTLIPKLTNIQIGKKPPQIYLSELQHQKNVKLAHSLSGHLIHREVVSDPTWNTYFKLFLDERASGIFALIDRYAIAPLPIMQARYGAQGGTAEPVPSNGRSRLKDMLADGRVKVGDQVYLRRYPERLATIVDGETVDFEGQQLLINTWGQQMTGWSSLNIYDNVFLERTHAPLKNLRHDDDHETAAAQ